jgi:hypothetical protein
MVSAPQLLQQIDAHTGQQVIAARSAGSLGVDQATPVQPLVHTPCSAMRTQSVAFGTRASPYAKACRNCRVSQAQGVRVSMIHISDGQNYQGRFSSRRGGEVIADRRQTARRVDIGPTARLAQPKAKALL